MRLPVTRCRLRAVQKVGSWLVYTGRDADVVVTAARGPVADIWPGPKAST